MSSAHGEPAQPRNDENQPGSNLCSERKGQPPDTPQDERPCLLVGTDRGTPSQDALRAAAALAARLHARLEVVHVIDLADFPIDPDSPHWESDAQAAVDEQRRQVTEVLVSFTGDWAFHVRRGDPATVLAAMAGPLHALIIVIGAARSGRSAALARIIDGSVARTLLSQGRLPVLIVPAGTPQDASP